MDSNLLNYYSKNFTLRYISVLIFCIGLVLTTKAQEIEQKDAHTQEETLDPAKLIMEHVLDAHQFHLLSFKGINVEIPLPIIVYNKQRGFSIFSSSKFKHPPYEYDHYKMEEEKIIALTDQHEIDETASVYDFSITRNVAQLLIGLFIFCFMAIRVAKKYAKNGIQVAPVGFQNALETVINFIKEEVAKPNIKKDFARFMPFLLTLFFFILIQNIFGLIPGTANVTGNIAFTLVLSTVALVVILLNTNKHFWIHIFWPPGVPFLVKLILIPVELSGVFIKPIALTIRLFANMIAGHIVITCFILLIFIFGGMNKYAGIGFVPVSVSFTIFIYLIEILVAFIQAFIFTNLTAVFIGQAQEQTHEHQPDHSHAS